MNYTGPKVKLSRKIGVNITPKAGKYATKKPYPPGQFGPNKRRAKQSDFGKQLLEKQKLRLQYNVTEKQMSNYYAKAASMPGNTAVFLDNCSKPAWIAVFRSGMLAHFLRLAIDSQDTYSDGKKVTFLFQMKSNES